MSPNDPTSRHQPDLSQPSPSRDEAARADEEGTASLARHPRSPAITIPPPPSTEVMGPPSSLPPRSGRRIDEYELLGLLGAGAYGEVWKAREINTGKIVAVKFFLHGASSRWQILLEEVRQHARMDGIRGIVDLKKVVTSAKPPYYVMAFADGGSLAGRLLDGAVSLPTAERLFRQITEALAYVHAKGICHCDLKPGNVLLDARNEALLADFGQAHLSTDASPALGTFFYMAPEQASLAEQLPDTRWDVYGLGAVLYALVTGRPPRYDTKIQEELSAQPDLQGRLACYRSGIARTPKPNAHRQVRGMDGNLAAIIDRCLHLDANQRFSDAGAVLDALRRREQRQRQRPLLIFSLAIALLLLAIMAGGATALHRKAMTSYQCDLAMQQMENNQTSASLVAEAVQERLLERIRRVERSATPELYRATAAADPVQLQQCLSRLLSTNGRPSSRFAEATVSNRKGELLAQVQIVQENRPDGERVPTGLRPLDLSRQQGPYRQFSWRDWFSGRGDRYDEAHLQHPPLERTHLSAPYVSSQGLRPTFLSVSVPIRAPNAPTSAPIGVLEAAFYLDDLTRWLGQAHIARRGFVALYDARNYCVYHPDPSHRPIFREAPNPVLTVAEATQLFGRPEGVVDHYRDPVDSRVCVVGYARMPRTGWLALVQHDRRELLAPVRALSSRLAWIGWQSFGLVALLISGLWGWLYYILRRGEQAVP